MKLKIVFFTKKYIIKCYKIKQKMKKQNKKTRKSLLNKIIYKNNKIFIKTVNIKALLVIIFKIYVLKNFSLSSLLKENERKDESVENRRSKGKNKY